MLNGEIVEPPDPCVAPVEPTLATIQAATFSPKCGFPGCHAPGGIGAMPLDSVENSHASLVGRDQLGVPSVEILELARVLPGDPEQSYLIWKLDGGYVAASDPRRDGQAVGF